MANYGNNAKLALRKWRFSENQAEVEPQQGKKLQRTRYTVTHLS